MYTKYITALKLMDDVIAARSISEDTNEQSVACNAAWDIAFEYIHANFAEPSTAMQGQITSVIEACLTIDPALVKQEYELCRPVIDNTYPRDNGAIEEIIRKIPPILLDIVWPVGVARFLLRDMELPIRHRELTTFDEFHRRYGVMILGC